MLTFELDGQDRVVEVSDDSIPARTVTYSYSGDLLSSVTSFEVNDDDPAPVTWAYGYDTDGRLESITNPNGDANFTHYDAEGRVDWELDYAGNRSDIVYGGAPGAEWREVTGPAFDAAGTRSTTRIELTGLLVTSITSGYGTPSARTVTYDHDPDLMAVTTVTASGPSGPSVQAVYDYDQAGNVVSVTDAAGRTTTSAYDDPGNPRLATEVTDPAGVTTSFTYDDAGNIETASVPVTGAGGAPEGTAVTTYQRGDPAHPEDVTAVIDPDGQATAAQTTMSYRSGDGLLEWVEDPEGNRTSFSYDTRGHMVASVSPRGNETGATPAEFETTFDVNDFGMPTAVTDPLGEVTSYTYDGLGNVVAVTDPNGHTTVTTFDGMSRPVLVERPDGSETATAYYPDGSVRAQVDGLGNPTNTFTYTVHGQVATVADALGNTTGYAYDGLGRLVARVEPGGSCPSTGCTTYSYDSGNQLVGIAYSDPATPDVAGFSYDPVGRRTAMAQDGRTGQSWSWDSLGRMRSATDINGDVTTYDWSLGGSLTGVGYPDRTAPVTYTYDAAGRATSVTDWDGRVTDFAFDADGNWTDTVFPAASGNSDHRVYDAAGRLTGVEWLKDTTVLGVLDYTRDPEGLITGETPTGAGFSTRTWGYDTLDQLTQADAATLEVDDAGNLTVTEDGRAQVFDPAQRLCWTSPTASGGDCQTPAGDATTYSYDARGNRTAMTYPSGTQAVYGYDQNNQMTTAVVPDQGLSTDGQYRPVPAATVVDTTTGTGTCDGAACARLGGSSTTDVTVTGVGAVPAAGDVVAVTGTLTVIDPAGDGHLDVNPDGGAAAATVFHDAGVDATVSFVAPTDANGRITVATTAATDVVVDVSGYHTTEAFVPSFNYWPTDAAVLADTATGVGVCDAGTCATLAADQSVDITAAGQGEVPADATAVVVSVVATGHTGDGTVRVTPNGAAAAGTVFLEANTPASMVVTAPVDGNGDITIHTSVAGDIAVHVSGWYAAPDPGGGDEGHALDLLPAPTRIADSSTGTGVCDGGTCTALGINDSIDIAVAGQAGIPADAAAAVVNITATDTTTGLIGLGLDGAAAAAIHLVRTGADSAFTATVPLNPDGTITLTSGLGAQAEFAIDVIGAYTPAVDTWTYTYDATGLRTAKAANDDAPTTYTWNTAAGLPLLLTQHRGTARHDIIYGPSGTPLYQVNPDDTVLYYHQDHQGSTRLTTGPNGNPRGRRTYTAYGTIATDTHPTFGHQPILGYTGQYHDTETGYIYLRARHHDPTTGQFTTRDPAIEETRDLYSYAALNPVVLSDPSGLWTSWDDVRETVEGVVEDVDRATEPIQQLAGASRRAVARGVRRTWDVAEPVLSYGYLDARFCPVYGCISVTLDVHEGLDFHYGFGAAFDMSLNAMAGDPSCERRQEFWAGARSLVGSATRYENEDGGFRGGDTDFQGGISLSPWPSFGVVEWFR